MSRHEKYLNEYKDSKRLRMETVLNKAPSGLQFDTIDSGMRASTNVSHAALPSLRHRHESQSVIEKQTKSSASKQVLSYINPTFSSNASDEAGENQISVTSGEGAKIARLGGDGSSIQLTTERPYID